MANFYEQLLAAAKSNHKPGLNMATVGPPSPGYQGGGGPQSNPQTILNAAASLPASGGAITPALPGPGKPVSNLDAVGAGVFGQLSAAAGAKDQKQVDLETANTQSSDIADYLQAAGIDPSMLPQINSLLQKMDSIDNDKTLTAGQKTLIKNLLGSQLQSLTDPNAQRLRQAAIAQGNTMKQQAEGLMASMQPYLDKLSPTLQDQSKAYIQQQEQAILAQAALLQQGISPNLLSYWGQYGPISSGSSTSALSGLSIPSSGSSSGTTIDPVTGKVVLTK